jgi:hypothetical protein
MRLRLLMLAVLLLVPVCQRPVLAQVVRKVLIIGVDGMRPDAMLAANTPTFDALIANGAFSTQCFAEDITISGPCWSSILTGVHRAKHGVNDNSFTSPNYSTYPHFFQRLQQSCDASTVSIAQWAPINTQICQANADVSLTGVPGASVAAACIEQLQTADPDVLFLHFDDVDHAGHASGFSPTIPEYLAAIEGVDALVGQVIAAIDARSTAAQEDWLIIVTSDHGGTPDRTHGRNIPEHRLTPLIVSGDSTAAGTTIAPAPEIVDVPATVMHFLGLPINPSWGWDGEPVGLNMAASPSVPFACVPPPAPPVGACCLATGECIQLTEPQCTVARGNWSGLGTPCVPGACPQTVTLFSEGFNAAPLGPNTDEPLAGAAVWSPTPPIGWTIDRSAMPTGGVTEWRGWSLASRSWWSQTAGDQNRSLFTKGVGTVAVADPDEWFDRATGSGLFRSSISTPTISLANAVDGTLQLWFDSSWRPDGLQAATLEAIFDGAPPVILFTWSSQAGPLFKPDAENETVSLDIPTPPAAATVVLRFTLRDAANNWWWAIDNLELRAVPQNPSRVLLAENFDAVPLGPNIDEALAADRVWSGAPPAGWAFDDSGVPGLADPARGVTEWEGWAITDRVWWSQTAGDQGRAQFTRASGAVAVADPDEWDDRGTPSALGPYNASMSTPQISLDGILPSSVTVGFDSSWRQEGIQAAELRVSYDGAPPITVLRWDSAPGPNFHADATNEAVLLNLNNPALASTMRLTFAIRDARNNWWWAIDNLRVTGDEACPADYNADGGVDGDDVILFFADWDNGLAAADFNRDGGVDGDDVIQFFSRWDTGC